MAKANLGDSLKKLGEIAAWFDAQQEVDLELGLEKAREGTRLIKLARERLRQIENEFEEVKKDLVDANEE